MLNGRYCVGLIVIVIPLPDSLDPKSSKKFAAELLERLGQDIRLDAVHLTKLHTIGVEMLIAARKLWDASEASFQIHGLSNEILEILNQIGLDAELREAESAL